MALNFPASPVLNETFPPPPAVARWVWNGSSWVTAPVVVTPMLPLTGGTLTGPGNLKVDGTLEVDGGTALDDLHVYGTATVEEETTLAKQATIWMPMADPPEGLTLVRNAGWTATGTETGYALVEHALGGVSAGTAFYKDHWWSGLRDDTTFGIGTANTKGAATDALVIDRGTRKVTLPGGDPTALLGVATKQYVDTTVSTQSAYQGTWNAATNVPDLTQAALRVNGFTWVMTTPDPTAPYTIPATPALPGLSGQVVYEGDRAIWSTAATSFQIVHGSSISLQEAEEFFPLKADALTRGVAGTYTQGTDFTVFQDFLDEKINNHFFDGDVIINLDVDNTGNNILISNISFTQNSNFTISTSEQIGTLVSIVNVQTYSFMILSSTAPVTCTSLALANCRVQLAGSVSIGSGQTNLINNAMLAMGMAATDNIGLASLIIGLRCEAHVSVANCAVGIGGAITVNGTLNIPAGTTNFEAYAGLPATYRGLIIDKRLTVGTSSNTFVPPFSAVVNTTSPQASFAAFMMTLPHPSTGTIWCQTAAPAAWTDVPAGLRLVAGANIFVEISPALGGYNDVTLTAEGTLVWKGRLNRSIPQWSIWTQVTTSTDPLIKFFYYENGKSVDYRCPVAGQYLCIAAGSGGGGVVFNGSPFNTATGSVPQIRAGGSGAIVRNQGTYGQGQLFQVTVGGGGRGGNSGVNTTSASCEQGTQTLIINSGLWAQGGMFGYYGEQAPGAGWGGNAGGPANGYVLNNGNTASTTATNGGSEVQVNITTTYFGSISVRSGRGGNPGSNGGHGMAAIIYQGP